MLCQPFPADIIPGDLDALYNAAQGFERVFLFALDICEERDILAVGGNDNILNGNALDILAHVLLSSVADTRMSFTLFACAVLNCII